VALENPARFGVGMPLIERGRPDNSYLFYKMLIQGASYGPDPCNGSVHEVPLGDNASGRLPRKRAACATGSCEENRCRPERALLSWPTICGLSSSGSQAVRRRWTATDSDGVSDCRGRRQLPSAVWGNVCGAHPRRQGPQRASGAQMLLGFAQQYWQKTIMRLSDYLTDCDLLIAGPAALGTRELADLFQASAADAEAEERRIYPFWSPITRTQHARCARRCAGGRDPRQCYELSNVAGTPIAIASAAVPKRVIGVAPTTRISRIRWRSG